MTMRGITSPTPRVWIATFIGLVFTIGMLAGVVVERVWLHPAFSGRAAIARGGGPGGPGGGLGRNGSPGGRGPGSGLNRGGPMFGPPPQQYVTDLSAEVQLTDSQRSGILTLLEAQETRLRAMQDDARALFIAEQTALHDKIAALLTPDQATAFRAWVTTRTGQRGRGQGR